MGYGEQSVGRRPGPHPFLARGHAIAAAARSATRRCLAAVLSIDPRSGSKRRHHFHEGSVGREVTAIVMRLGFYETCHETTLGPADSRRRIRGYRDGCGLGLALQAAKMRLFSVCADILATRRAKPDG